MLLCEVDLSSHPDILIENQQTLPILNFLCIYYGSGGETYTNVNDWKHTC